MVSARTFTTSGGDGWVDCLDTRLVAAVQAAAGARCHEAASLVQAYYFSSEACRRLASGHRGGATAAEARRRMTEAKVRLRDFLAERVLGWVGGGAGVRRGDMDRCGLATVESC
jgi:hypothetical protein